MNSPSQVVSMSLSVPWLAAMTFWRAVAGSSVVSRILASKRSTMAAPALQMA